MLVVADQRALGIGGQRRLSRAGQAEKDRGVAVRADIGRTVHRKDVLLGQRDIQRGEHAVLDLAGIRRPADQDDLAGEIDRDDVLRAVRRDVWDRRGKLGRSTMMVNSGTKLASSDASVGSACPSDGAAVLVGPERGELPRAGVPQGGAGGLPALQRRLRPGERPFLEQPRARAPGRLARRRAGPPPPARGGCRARRAHLRAYSAQPAAAACSTASPRSPPSASWAPT